jgi:hypothetical protein
MTERIQRLATTRKAFYRLQGRKIEVFGWYRGDLKSITSKKRQREQGPPAKLKMASR